MLPNSGTWLHSLEHRDVVALRGMVNSMSPPRVYHSDSVTSEWPLTIDRTSTDDARTPHTVHPAGRTNVSTVDPETKYNQSANRKYFTPVAGRDSALNQTGVADEHRYLTADESGLPAPSAAAWRLREGILDADAKVEYYQTLLKHQQQQQEQLPRKNSMPVPVEVHPREDGAILAGVRHKIFDTNSYPKREPIAQPRASTANLNSFAEASPERIQLRAMAAHRSAITGTAALSSSQAAVAALHTAAAEVEREYRIQHDRRELASKINRRSLLDLGFVTGGHGGARMLSDGFKSAEEERRAYRALILNGGERFLTNNEACHIKGPTAEAWRAVTVAAVGGISGAASLAPPVTSGSSFRYKSDWSTTRDANRAKELFQQRQIYISPETAQKLFAQAQDETFERECLCEVEHDAWRRLMINAGDDCEEQMAKIRLRERTALSHEEVEDRFLIKNMEGTAFFHLAEMIRRLEELQWPFSLLGAKEAQARESISVIESRYRSDIYQSLRLAELGADSVSDTVRKAKLLLQSKVVGSTGDRLSHAIEYRVASTNVEALLLRELQLIERRSRLIDKGYSPLRGVNSGIPGRRSQEIETLSGRQELVLSESDVPGNADAFYSAHEVLRYQPLNKQPLQQPPSTPHGSSFSNAPPPSATSNSSALIPDAHRKDIFQPWEETVAKQLTRQRLQDEDEARSRADALFGLQTSSSEQPLAPTRADVDDYVYRSDALGRDVEGSAAARQALKATELSLRAISSEIGILESIKAYGVFEDGIARDEQHTSIPAPYAYQSRLEFGHELDPEEEHGTAPLIPSSLQSRSETNAKISIADTQTYPRNMSPTRPKPIFDPKAALLAVDEALSAFYSSRPASLISTSGVSNSVHRDPGAFFIYNAPNAVTSGGNEVSGTHMPTSGESLEGEAAQPSNVAPAKDTVAEPELLIEDTTDSMPTSRRTTQKSSNTIAKPRVESGHDRQSRKVSHPTAERDGSRNMQANDKPAGVAHRSASTATVASEASTVSSYAKAIHTVASQYKADPESLRRQLLKSFSNDSAHSVKRLLDEASHSAMYLNDRQRNVIGELPDGQVISRRPTTLLVEGTATDDTITPHRVSVAYHAPPVNARRVPEVFRSPYQPSDNDQSHDGNRIEENVHSVRISDTAPQEIEAEEFVENYAAAASPDLLADTLAQASPHVGSPQTTLSTTRELASQIQNMQANLPTQPAFISVPVPPQSEMVPLSDLHGPLQPHNVDAITGLAMGRGSQEMSEPMFDQWWRQQQRY